MAGRQQGQRGQGVGQEGAAHAQHEGGEAEEQRRPPGRRLRAGPPREGVERRRESPAEEGVQGGRRAQDLPGEGVEEGRCRLVLGEPPPPSHEHSVDPEGLGLRWGLEEEPALEEGPGLVQPGDVVDVRGEPAEDELSHEAPDEGDPGEDQQREGGGGGTEDEGPHPPDGGPRNRPAEDHGQGQEQQGPGEEVRGGKQEGLSHHPHPREPVRRVTGGKRDGPLRRRREPRRQSPIGARFLASLPPPAGPRRDPSVRYTPRRRWLRADSPQPAREREAASETRGSVGSTWLFPSGGRSRPSTSPGPATPGGVAEPARRRVACRARSSRGARHGRRAPGSPLAARPSGDPAGSSNFT